MSRLVLCCAVLSFLVLVLCHLIFIALCCVVYCLTWFCLILSGLVVVMQEKIGVCANGIIFIRKVVQI